MIHIVICCNNGVCSGFFAKRLAIDVKERHLEEEVCFDFQAFQLFQQHYQDYDIAFLCPHLLYAAKTFIAQEAPDIPLYIIPPRIYGSMRLDDLLEDAKDLLELYDKHPVNFIHFEGEEDPLRIRRERSHQAWLKLHNK